MEVEESGRPEVQEQEAGPQEQDRSLLDTSSAESSGEEQVTSACQRRQTLGCSSPTVSGQGWANGLARLRHRD